MSVNNEGVTGRDHRYLLSAPSLIRRRLSQPLFSARGGGRQLGTEAPTRKLLARLPMRRNASLISRVMWRNILVQATFQLALLLAILRDGEAIFGVQVGSVQHFTLIFTVFVFCQVKGGRGGAAGLRGAGGAGQRAVGLLARLGGLILPAFPDIRSSTSSTPGPSVTT